MTPDEVAAKIAEIEAKLGRPLEHAEVGFAKRWLHIPHRPHRHGPGGSQELVEALIEIGGVV